MAQTAPGWRRRWAQPPVARPNLDAEGGWLPDGTATRGGPLRPLLLSLGAVLAVAAFWRGYQQVFGWSCPVATDPCFGRTWIRLLVGQSVLLASGAGGWYLWLARGCRRCREQRAATGSVTASHEGGHMWRLWIHLSTFTFVLYLAGSYFAEQDASWHQVAVRDTAFTPSHIVLFFGAFPLAIALALGTYLYARTRLPGLFRDRGFPLSFGLLISGAVLLLVQVSFNEWAHSFWIVEEIFAAPLHWGFVVFAYLLAGTFAVWFQTVPRLLELAALEGREAAERDERDAAATSAPQGADGGR